ncbi:MAG: hypothetical protein WA709_30355, partial [Stellaceae bacterium]
MIANSLRTAACTDGKTGRSCRATRFSTRCLIIGARVSAIDAEEIEHVEAQQRNVRRLQDITPGVEDDVGRALARLLRGLPSDAGQCLGRELQARQHPHAAAHCPKALPPAYRKRRVAALSPRKASGELDHEARVDAFG